MEEKKREEWMAVLRKSRLCRNLEETELLSLMEREGTVRTYSRGKRIFQETDRPDSVYMLLSGSVIIAKEKITKKRILLARLEEKQEILSADFIDKVKGECLFINWKIRVLCLGRFMPLWENLPMICMWRR